MKKKIIGLFAFSLFLINSCTQQEEKVEQTENDWIILFDGTSLEGWKGYNGEGLPPGWTIQDSTMTFSTDVVLEQNYNYNGSKDIIYAAEEFDNFELYVEWKIPAGGNSGIFYHVKEGFDGIPEIAPEYQLIDDEGYTKMHDISDYNKSLGYTENLNELKDWQKTGSDYAMYPAKAEKNLNPVGEWNSSRIIFTPEKAEYYLNGDLVVSFTPWSEDWNEKKNHGKWKIASDYGKFKTGYIGFQDHGSGLAFRNVKIRKL